ncbi:hypothetical protein [Butyrivibrio sp. AE3009]|uniref:hypothetical protein n=1 Tax=Butyrivibrio sp. AE3009 TaxID=1280666 RepID=UPI0003B79A15|nr:hypothetical protein [Butyrivibrio sp. AE3009]
MKKMFMYVLMIAITVTMLNSGFITVYAKTTCAHAGCDRGVDSGSYCRLHKCGKSGCNSEKGGNGTIYCNRHASEYVKSEGYKTCSVSGCMKKATRGSYCSSHACMRGGCNNKRVEGSNLCSTHESKSTTTSLSSKTTKKNSTSKYSSTKKNSSKSSTKKKYDQYDVYNYKSAQSFADDKYEEFYDYEDDYEDEDEAYDAAEDYWRDHH